MYKQNISKEEQLNSKICKLVQPYSHAARLVQAMLKDEEIHVVQHYANVVSVRRLGFNDHGPVHMRQVVYGALQILNLLKEASIQTSLEEEGVGSYEDSLCAVILAGFLHDLGMSLTRERHEETSLIIAYPIINRLLDQIYGADPKRFIVRSVVLECIIGHMTTVPVHSIESGVLLVADGCDMECGRAKAPLILHSSSQEGHMGDIHRYSADGIESVRITKGEEKPVRIVATMNTTVGLFQVEEVLLKKVTKSSILTQVELFAVIEEGETRRYL